MADQRYQAVSAVISDGVAISQGAEKVGVSRQTLHSWLARCEAEGLEGLADWSHRPVRCPHQMPAAVTSAVYRALPRAGMIDPAVRDRRSRKRKRWERGAPIQLGQIDVVGGFPLADDTSAKALTGIDDHSRMGLRAVDTPRTHPGGLRRVARRVEHLRGTRADPDCQRPRCSLAGSLTGRPRCCLTRSVASTISSTC